MYTSQAFIFPFVGVEDWPYLILDGFSL
jgi:hypothetical protein